MWEFEIKDKKTGQGRKIYGETVGNAFRRFGMDRERWILIRKTEIEDPPGPSGKGRPK